MKEGLGVTEVEEGEGVEVVAMGGEEGGGGEGGGH